MSRVDVTEIEVVTAILARLRSQLKLSENQCWFTTDPSIIPDLPPGGEYFATVAIGDGQFPDGEQIAGNITEDTSIGVTIYSRMRLDRTDKDIALLAKKDNGLFALKKKVLAALVGHDLTNEDDDTFLRQLLHALDCTRPVYDKTKAVGYLTIAFGVSFDWELT